MKTENQSTPNIGSFQKFDLAEPIAQALETMKYLEPTPIQEKGIPLVMSGKDLIGIAQTGTGKTAAFGIPMISMLLADKSAQGVILVPTRELAVQVYDVMRKLTQNIKSIKTWVIIGGTSMFAQAKSLPKNPRLIIATPGRLQDHLDRKTFNLNNLKMVVLDEADRMLDIGFEPQIRKIFYHVPKTRQTLLFSATFPREIDRLTRDYMTHPEKITIGKISEPGKDIEQSFISTSVDQKNGLLVKELNERTGSVLVFVRTKHKVDRIARMLEQENFEVARIHGDRTQGQRSRAMSDFRNKIIRVLIATDVASRGIDIPHIEHVINYDLPEAPEDYVHRIGRTARAGAKGQSVSFVTSEDKSKWMYLSRHLNTMGMKIDSSTLQKVIGVTSIKMPPKTEQTEPEQKAPRDYSQRRHGRPKYRPKQARLQSNHPSSDRPRRDYGADRTESRPRSSERSPSRSYAPRGDSARPNSRPYAPRGDSARSGRGYEGRSSEGSSRSFSGPRSSTSRRPEGAPRGRSDFRPYNSENRNTSGRFDSRERGPRPDSRNGDRPNSRFARPDRPRSDAPRYDSRSSTDSRTGYAKKFSDRPNFSPRSDVRGNFRPRPEGSSPRSDTRSFGGPTNGSAKPRPRVRPGKFSKKPGSYPRSGSGNKGKPRDTSGSSRNS